MGSGDSGVEERSDLAVGCRWGCSRMGVEMGFGKGRLAVGLGWTWG